MKKIIISLEKFVAIMSLILAFTINIKAQESEIYWINEDFSTFEIQSAWVTTEANYLTAPNDVVITTYYANVEAAEGSCNGTGNNFRVRGLGNNGYLTFTVENAGTVTIDVKAKGNTADRIAYIYRDDVLIGTYTGLSKNSCATFHEEINSSIPVIYKIIGEAESDNTSPILVSSIVVTKFNAPIVPFTITASVNGGNGNIYPEGIIEVLPGEDTAFSIIPNADYKINVVRVNGHIVFMNHQNIYEFLNVSQNNTIEASFIPIPDPDVYWIHENFSDFETAPNYIFDASLNPIDSIYPTIPNNIELKTFYANFEESEGICNNESLNLRLRGSADGGYAEFSVPNAKSVKIVVKGKSTAGDRFVNIYRNNVLVDSLLNLDRDNCAIFYEEIESFSPLTYKIVGGDYATLLKPVVISSIIVEKSLLVNVNNFNKNQLLLYPNPVQDFLYIQNDKLSDFQTINVINIMGQSLINQKLTEENVQKIDVKNLPIGVYVIHISNNLG
ncbi:MAG: T9SS type A sorting domain-containing protein, partial [Bacteroidales bacterium]|nr:T9SS type A sorting domain-containing protein [Bacteroidales bacterium]